MNNEKDVEIRCLISF